MSRHIVTSSAVREDKRLVNINGHPLTSTPITSLGICPDCHQRHPNTTRERRMNGITKCGNCGHSFSHQSWDILQELESTPSTPPTELPVTLHSTAGHLLVALGKTLVSLPREIVKDGEEYVIAAGHTPSQILSSLGIILNALDGSVDKVTPIELEDAVSACMSEE